MDASTILELFGYLGSLVVIISMLMTSVFKLRVINTMGSLMFSAYALMIHSYPTMVMNLFLAGINIWHLMKLRNTHKHYDLIEIAPGDPFLEHLIVSFQDDILKFFPRFSPDKLAGCRGYVILCQSSPAGVFLARGFGEKEEAGAGGSKELKVVLDYTTPTYRDCSVGRYLYETLFGMGYEGLIAEAGSDAHRKYLEKMGFCKGNGSAYTLELKKPAA